MGGLLQFAIGLSVLFAWRQAGCQAKQCTKRRVAQPWHPAHLHLEYVLLLCFSFSSIFVEGNEGFPAVCSVLRGMLCVAMH